MLTYRQTQIMAWITQFWLANRMPPTLREIGKQFSIFSVNGVDYHLSALVRKGCLKKNRGARCLQLLKLVLPTEDGGVLIVDRTSEPLTRR